MTERKTKQITVSISDEAWEWWNKNRWLRLSPILEREIRKARKETNGRFKNNQREG